MTNDEIEKILSARNLPGILNIHISQKQRLWKMSFEELSKEFKWLLFVRVNVDKCPDTQKDCRVSVRFSRTIRL